MAKALRFAVVLVTILALAGCTRGESPDPRPFDIRALPTVEPPLAPFPDQFSLIVGSALVDGQLVVADRMENMVAFLQFETGRRRYLGAEGPGGPGEYGAVEGVFRYRGDTLAVRADRQWLLFLPTTGESLGTRRPPWLGLVSKVDGAPDGSAVFLSGNLGGSPLDAPTEEPVGPLRGKARVDTIASIRLRETMEIPMESEQGVSVFRRAHPLGMRDLWAAAPSGMLVVARNETYRIEGILADGTIRAFQLDVPSVPVWPEDRAEADERFEWVWPSEKPPFGSGAVVAAASGKAWVPLNEDSRSATREYIIVDLRIGPGARVRFPRGFRVLRVGEVWGYGLLTDPDTGLSTISRFPIEGAIS